MSAFTWWKQMSKILVWWVTGLPQKSWTYEYVLFVSKIKIQRPFSDIKKEIKRNKWLIGCDWVVYMLWFCRLLFFKLGKFFSSFMRICPWPKCRPDIWSHFFAFGKLKSLTTKESIFLTTIYRQSPVKTPDIKTYLGKTTVRTYTINGTRTVYIWSIFQSSFTHLLYK